MKDAKRYSEFQMKVFEGFEDGARLDRLEAERHSLECLCLNCANARTAFEDGDASVEELRADLAEAVALLKRAFPAPVRPETDTRSYYGVNPGGGSHHQYLHDAAIDFLSRAKKGN